MALMYSRQPTREGDGAVAAGPRVDYQRDGCAHHDFREGGQGGGLGMSACHKEEAQQGQGARELHIERSKGVGGY